MVNLPEILRHFRCITFLTNIGVGSLVLEEVIKSVEKFDIDFKSTLRISENRNLHLLYGRNITFLGVNITQEADLYKELVERVRLLGFTTTLKLSLPDLLENSTSSDLLRISSASSVIIEAALTPNLSMSKVTSVVEGFIASRKSVLLKGPFTFWKQTGLLRRDASNSTSLRVLPSEADKIGNLASLPTPCSGRFQIFVDAHGFAWPCQGLIGKAEYNLGKLESSIQSLSHRALRLDLEYLAVRGPRKFRQPDALFGNLPWICVAHRNALTKSMQLES